MKSVNVIRNPRKKSTLSQAKIKEYLETWVIGNSPVRILSVNRFQISDGIRGKTIEATFVIFDRKVDLSREGLDDYREIRWQIFEGGTPGAGGIFG